MKRALIFLSCLFFCFSLFAGTVRLANNSPYQLRAVIRGADGSYLGEMVINAGQTMSWSDTYGPVGPGGGVHLDEPTRSQTPYTVLWYCLDGNDYSINSDVATGGMAIAQYGDGARICKPKKQPPPNQQQQAPEEYLQQQPETEETPQNGSQ